MLNNLIQIYLESHPEDLRPQEELDRLEDLNLFGGDMTDLSKPIEAPVQPECRQCTKAVRGFKCKRNQRHVQCSKCNQAMPLRADTQQQCSCCNAFFCNLYWDTAPRCAGGLNPLESYIDTTFTGMSDSSINGNKFEQNVLQDYLNKKRTSYKKLAQTLVASADQEAWVLEVPEHTPATYKANSTVCTDCAVLVWNQLLYKYREQINDQLPRYITKRDDCWHGKECRTQRQNIMHAQKLNHICNRKQ